MLTCRNQSCRAQWEQAEVQIHNEGQGLMYRCPLCGSRNYVQPVTKKDGSIVYKPARD
jgi:DNA-directed RNA polymerase subunit RPC12/RpoP